MPPAMPISVSTGHTLSFVYKGYLANLQIDEKTFTRRCKYKLGWFNRGNYNVVRESTK